MKPTLKHLIKYITITVAGVALYFLAAGVAFNERGYKACGGELVFLLLPLWWMVGEIVVRDIKQTIKNLNGGNEK